MIYSELKIVLFFKIVNWLMIRIRHILLKLQGDLLAKVSLNHIWKTVRNLLFSCQNFPDQSRPTYSNIIDLSELYVLKTFFYKTFDVKL